MTLKLKYKLPMLLVMILNIGILAGCSALVSTPTPVIITTNTITSTQSPSPSATFTLKVEPSLPPTIMPTISLPQEIISSQNISQLRKLDSRHLSGIPKEFFPRSMDFTPDGRMVAAVDNTIVYIWDGLASQQNVTLDHSLYLWNVAISPDGVIVASGGESGVIKVWDLKTGKELHKFNHPGTIWGLAFSPDSTILASGTLNQSIKLWNLIDGKELGNLNDVLVESLAFSPDGKLLAIGTDYKIILWDVVSKKPIKTLVFDLRGGEGLSGIQGVLFSPDGKMIAAADADNIAMVWEVSSGKKLNTIIGHGTIIRMSEGTLAFSPDNKMLATGNDNGDVIFWDVLADKELWRIATCVPLDLIFGFNGHVFEVGCLDGRVELWGIQ